MHSPFLPAGSNGQSKEQPFVVLATALPVADWPAYIKELIPSKIEGDRGIGDVAERVIGRFGSNAFRVWYSEKVGVWAKQCGCANWKPIWNARYPFA